ncbi:MAG TPA: hypothetical protein VGL99_25520 [Chloroflexota bacterium]|jgi:hypothetical protein
MASWLERFDRIAAIAPLAVACGPNAQFATSTRVPSETPSIAVSLFM